MHAPLYRCCPAVLAERAPMDGMADQYGAERQIQQHAGEMVCNS